MTIPSGNLFEYCSSGYVSVGDPRRDLMRLGALCGAVNGMQAPEPSFAVNLADGETRRRLKLEAGHCARVVVAAGEQGDRRLELEWWRAGHSLAACEHSSWGLCPPDRALCVEADSDLDLVVRINGRNDSVAAQFWLMNPSATEGSTRAGATETASLPPVGTLSAPPLPAPSAAASAASE